LRAAVVTVLARCAVSAEAAPLVDGTPIPVRLQIAFDSESAVEGQTVTFVVTHDIVSGHTVVIPRGTIVNGVVVKARAVHWGFVHHHPLLAFAFRYLIALNGTRIGLRSSLARGPNDRVDVIRHRHHHELLWASEADTFDAYVNGTYEIPER
jgi:hypothetical protein